MNSYDHFMYEFICYEFMYMKKCMNYITYECISCHNHDDQFIHEFM